MTLTVGSALQSVFIDGLPRRPYSTNCFEYGVYRESREHALSRRYIEPNSPIAIRVLPIDIDRPEAGAAWYDAGAPPPNFTVINRDNGHAHLLYLLRTPVLIGQNARTGPLAYLAAVEAGLLDILKADPAYSGKFTKNPLHPYWVVREIAPEPYTLAELSNALPPYALTRKPRREEYVGTSRHLDLFDALRRWGYGAARTYRDKGSYEAFYEAVLRRAFELNTFAIPLPVSALRATAKGVTRFSWEHAYHFGTRPLGGLDRSLVHYRDRLPSALTPEEVALRQAEGGRYAARKNAEQKEARVFAVLECLAAHGEVSPSARKVALIAGVSAPTASKYLKLRATYIRDI